MLIIIVWPTQNYINNIMCIIRKCVDFDPACSQVYKLIYHCAKSEPFW